MQLWRSFSEIPSCLLLTSLLLVEGQLGPVLLHAVTESHPQLSLLLQGHTLPSLLNIGQRGVGDGVGGGGSAGDEGGGGGLTGGRGDGGAQRTGSRNAHHFEDCVDLIAA